MDGVLVQDVALGAARLHHHAPAHRVEGVGDDARHGGDGLRDGPADHDGSVLGVGQHAARRVVEAEVGRAVDDDALHGHAEAPVEPRQPVRLEDLREAVPEAGELALALARALADVGGEPRSREVQRVHEAQRGGPRGAAGRQVPGEVAPELRVLVHATQEHLLVLVLEGEVERLRGEVPDDVGEVAAPEGQQALLARDAHERVHDTLVALVGGDLLADVLHLQQQFHALDGRHGGLGDGGGDAAGEEVLRERYGIGEVLFLGHFVLLLGPFFSLDYGTSRAWIEV